MMDEAGTYTEVSPSGDCLHLIFRGSKPDGAEHSRRGQPSGRVVEIYDHNHYFTVTGNVSEWSGAAAANSESRRHTVRGSNLSGRRRGRVLRTRRGHSQMRALLVTWSTRSSSSAWTPSETATTSAPSWPVTAQPRVATARLRTWRSAATWHSGARGAVRMDRIFRSSRLMRSKHKSRQSGTTSGTQSIGRAISNATEFYQPERKGSAAGVLCLIA